MWDWTNVTQPQVYGVVCFVEPKTKNNQQGKTSCFTGSEETTFRQKQKHTNKQKYVCAQGKARLSESTNHSRAKGEAGPFMSSSFLFSYKRNVRFKSDA